MPIFPNENPPYPVSYLIDRTFDLLLGPAREERNKTSQIIQPDDPVVQLQYPPGGAQTGTYVAIDDEVFYVWDVGAGNSIMVERAQRGSRAAFHPAGSQVFVNPYFTRYEVRRTLQDEIRSWGPQVFAVRSLDIDSATFVNGYDLGNLKQWLNVISVTVSPDVLSGAPSDKDWATVPYRVVHNAALSDFPSGNALFVESPPFSNPRTLHVTYAADFDVDTSFLDDTDLTDTVGVDPHLMDVPPWGAAWRLLASWEMRRLAWQAQGQEADISDTQAGATVVAAANFKKLRDMRLNDAEVWLKSQYGTFRR